MKRYLISLLLLSAALGLAGCDGKSRSTSLWTDADGSAEKPYLIYTAEDLNAVRGGVPGYEGWGLDKHYKVMQDIDLSGYADGEGWVPIGTLADPFTGSFDGNGKVIIGLAINRAGEFQGLFGCAMTAAEIKNVALSSVNVHGGNDTGGLVGYNRGKISNSYATGTVTGGNDTGGLVGYNNNATISNSYATGAVSGSSCVGGLAGYSNNATISNSYATGAVSGSSYVGGLIGYQAGWSGAGDGTSYSYATGAVSGGSSVGGLVGGNNDVMQDCRWITDNTNGLGLCGNGSIDPSNLRLTDADGKKQASFPWDFVDTWRIQENVSYPELQWQQ